MRCRCCGNNNLKQLIDLGIQPVAHNLLVHREDSDKVVNPLLLHYCEECGFIQINEPIPPEKLYLGYNYCFSAWKKEPHIQDEIALLEQYVPNKQIKILEIGCNDGVFIGPLLKAGYTNYVGVEPNSFAANEAKNYHVPIVNEMFDSETALGIKKEHGAFDLIVMRQVLEHIVDLDGLFEGIKQLMEGEASFLVEVPNFKKAIDSGDCSTIWEEHPNYFTQDVLEKLWVNHFFYVIHQPLTRRHSTLTVA